MAVQISNAGNGRFGFSFSQSLQNFKLGGSGGGGGAITKAFLDGFRDNSTLEIGRTSVATLKDPVTDAGSLPTGVTQSAGTVTIASPFTGTLSDWDFRDYSVVVSTATGVVFSQCVFGEITGVPGIYPLAVNVGGQISEIAYCDFLGMGYGGSGLAAVQNSSGAGMSFAAGQLNWIHHCRFEDWPGDSVNMLGCVGGQLLEYCYFAPTNNLPYEPTTYSAATTYALGDIVFSAQGYVFVSLSAGNIGNTPPTTKTDSAFWESYDPHADQITVKAAIESVTIRRNLFDHTEPPGGETWSNVGVNNIIRAVRNSGTDFVVNDVTISENLMYHDGSSLPLGLGLEGANTTGVITLTNNWCASNTNGSYWSVADPGADVFSGNLDSATDANIDALVPDRNRVTLITPVGVSTTSMNLTFSVAARGGTFEYVVTTSSTRPTAAQILAGQDHTGAAATANGTLSITTAGSQTISAITLPSEFVGFVHVAYDREGRVFTGSSGQFSLAAIDYATRGAADSAQLTGPALPSSLHSITFRIKFTTADGTPSNAQFLWTLGNGFLLRHDTRNTKRSFSFLMENSAGTSYTLTIPTITDLTYTPNTNVELICTMTQNRYQENSVEGDHAGARVFVNGVLTNDYYALTTGTGVFQAQAQRLLDSNTYAMGIRSLERWDNVWQPDGDLSALGTADLVMDGNEVFWNGTGLPSGWAKTGANAFT